MRCARIEEYLHAYMDGELPPMPRRQVEEHMKACAACRAHVQALWALDATLRAVPLPEASDALTARILAAASEYRAGRAARRPMARWWGGRWKPWALRMAVAAVVLLGLGLGGWLGTHTIEEHRRQKHLAIEAVDDTLDAFADAPAGSLAGAYLALTAETDRRTP
ncbi:MAG: zf-HC2 domain-containing protein [Kiritimatiellae bacterium]|nr:zf-HC2 domain-containing protein [Kiritimatiellia bacterium]